MILRGVAHESVVPSFFGATLCALKKKDSGLRPIAVGNTLRRLAAKAGLRQVSTGLGAELRPVQLGFGTQGGCEAAVDAASEFIRGNQSKNVLLEIDMKNAFNSIHRDKLLSVVRNRTPGLYKFIWQAYANESRLFYEGAVIASSTGIQQGDPAGPALFSLGVDAVARQARSPLNIWYLDDALIGGNQDDVLSDIQFLIPELNSLGLEVNDAKCEIFLLNHTPLQCEESFAILEGEGGRGTKGGRGTILARSASDYVGHTMRSRGKNLLKLMVGRLSLLDPHYAFVLLKGCFALPRFLFLLRASKSFTCTETPGNRQNNARRSFIYS
jgi:hypothetical protein